MGHTQFYLYSSFIGDHDLVIALLLGMKLALNDIVIQNDISLDDFSLMAYFPYIKRNLNGVSTSFFSTLDSKKYLIFHSSVAFAVPEYSLKKKINESGYISHLS